MHSLHVTNGLPIVAFHRILGGAMQSRNTAERTPRGPSASHRGIRLSGPAGAPLVAAMMLGVAGMAVGGASGTAAPTGAEDSATGGPTDTTGETVVDTPTEGTVDTVVDTTVAEPPAPALPVVPGLVGFGTTTPAGRGGAVLVVSTLADDGPGSLRDALRTAGPRIVVFEVAGTIELERPLIVTEPYLTLAGQSAPHPGITIAGSQVSIRTHDVLVQHVRVRPGDRRGGDPEGISLYQPGGAEVHDIVIDHTSISWAIDENANTWSATATEDGPHAGVHDVTFSNNLIAEALDDSTHPEGRHSNGMLVGDGSERIAVLRNVFVHNADRNPDMTGGTSTLVVNNIVHGWDPKREATHLGRAGGNPDEPTCASVVGNVYLRSGWMGPSAAAAIEIHRDLPPGSMLYASDNLAPNVELIRNESDQDPLVGAPPLWVEGLQVLPAATLLEPVLGGVGARPAGRDSVDQRLLADVWSGTGAVIDSQDDVGGWPLLDTPTRTLAIPDDPHGDADADGYTNIEEWLHELAALVETGSPDPLPPLVGTTLPVADDPRCS